MRFGVDYGNSASGGNEYDSALKSMYLGTQGLKPFENGVTTVYIGVGYTYFWCDGYTQLVVPGNNSIYVDVYDKEMNATRISSGVPGTLTLPSGSIILSMYKGSDAVNKVLTFS